MRKYLTLTTLALGLAASAVSALPIDTLKGSIKENKTLTADKDWVLVGFVTVDSGYTLTIEPGVVVMGQKSTKGTLAIAKGAKIIAVGTKDKPIRFSSDEESKTRGSWGGLVILGRAKSNLSGALKFEARDEWAYGGTDDNDSSGVLKYVRLEYPGFPVAPDKELNGVTMAAVGRKTMISHVQVHNGDDDGFEFFGGTVSPTNLVVTNQVDDAFDSDNGFTGTVQWAVNVQGTEGDRQRCYIVKNSAGQDSTQCLANEVVGDKGFESSSTKVTTGDANPQTNPTWMNITVIDNGKSGGAVNLNEHAVGTFSKVLLVGDSSAYAVRLQSTKTNAGLLANPQTLKFVKSYRAGTWKSVFTTDDTANAALITAALNAGIKPVGNALYSDLGLANDTLMADSVGAILGSDPKEFWTDAWTYPGTLTYAKGATRPAIGVRRDRAFRAHSEFFSVRLSDGRISVRSAFDATVSLEVKDINGRTLFARHGVKLALGENELGAPWGNLPAGAYFLVLKSGNYSLHKRLETLPR